MTDVTMSWRKLFLQTATLLLYIRGTGHYYFCYYNHHHHYYNYYYKKQM